MHVQNRLRIATDDKENVYANVSARKDIHAGMKSMTDITANALSPSISLLYCIFLSLSLAV
jgi:hypothetical protein